MADVLFLPVKPVYAARYLDGSKTAELKKHQVRGLRKGHVVVIYETAPAKRIVATAAPGLWCGLKAQHSGDVVCHPAWRSRLAISDEEIVTYLLRTGVPSETGVAIEFSSVTPLENPVPLDAIREAIPGFRVPQSYCWLRGDRAEAILRLCGVVEA